MKVFIVVDLVYSSPENMGATAYSTREGAETARDQMIKESEGDSEYIVEIHETDLQQ